MQSRIVAVCLALVACFAWSEACSCIPESMRHRNVGCKDEFMAVVNITGLSQDEMRHSYSFSIVQDRTPSLVDHASLSPFHTITTNSNSAACGVHLDINSTYLLKGSLSANGGTPHVMLCNSYFRKLDHVPTAVEAHTLLDELFAKQC